MSVVLARRMGPPTFEAVEIGVEHDLAPRWDVTAADITAFGRQYEPWIQHVDPEAAGESKYVNRLTAGTFHIVAIGLRLLYDGLLADSGAVDTVAVADAWRAYQVHPGDTLGVRAEAAETDTVSDRLGTVAYDVRVLEESEAVEVLTMRPTIAFLRAAAVDGASGEDEQDG